MKDRLKIDFLVTLLCEGISGPNFLKKNIIRYRYYR